MTICLSIITELLPQKWLDSECMRLTEDTHATNASFTLLQETLDKSTHKIAHVWYIL